MNSSSLHRKLLSMSLNILWASCQLQKLMQGSQRCMLFLGFYPRTMWIFSTLMGSPFNKFFFLNMMIESEHADYCVICGVSLLYKLDPDVAEIRRVLKIAFAVGGRSCRLLSDVVRCLRWRRWRRWQINL